MGEIRGELGVDPETPPIGSAGALGEVLIDSTSIGES
jgi:hypothetical protein